MFNLGIATTSHQSFYPQNRSLSIAQPSISSGQLNFDPKTNPYHFLSGNGLPGADSALAALQVEHANLINSQQLSQLQLQQEIYNQHLMKINMANMQPSSLMSVQNAPLKGGISAGYPIMPQRPGNPNTSTNTNSNNRFPYRY